MQTPTPRGVTLVEGIIFGGVIALILFSTGFAVSQARARARDYKRLADLVRIQSSLEFYFNEYNRYPLASQPVVLGAGDLRCLGADGFAAACPTDARVFLNPVPRQTETGLSAGDLKSYTYQSDGDAAYVLAAVLERAIPDAQLSAGLVCAHSGEALQSAQGGSCTL